MGWMEGGVEKKVRAGENNICIKWRAGMDMTIKGFIIPFTPTIYIHDRW